MSEIKVIEYRDGAGHSAAPTSVIGLGLFDGVHIGHRALLRRVVEEARAVGIIPAVFTFSEGGRGLKAGSPRIYGDALRLRLLAELGIELVYSADFSSLSGLSPEEFVTRVLVGELNCAVAVAGFNFRFGRGASGDADTLASLMSANGRSAITVADEQLGGSTVSSTRIRTALAEGSTAEAAELLGAPYLISGEVKHGRGKGRIWGFPTLNTEVEGNIPLAGGVYATAVAVGEGLYAGVTNLGTCPSFGARELHAETLLLDFDGDLYGRQVDIYFIDRLREERSFSSPEELREQIERDAERARERMGNRAWQAIGRR